MPICGFGSSYGNLCLRLGDFGGVRNLAVGEGEGKWRDETESLLLAASAGDLAEIKPGIFNRLMRTTH